MAEIWLICEGKSDVAVLSPVFANVLAADIVCKPCGGSAGAASAAAYLAQNEGGVAVAYVIDRDYEARAIADATFADGRRRFMWRRHAIESYLLQPEVIVEAFRIIRQTTPDGGPPWVAGLPLDPAVVADALRDCAKLRAPQEAGRIALQRLWEDLRDTAGQVEKRNPPTLSSGNPSPDECRQGMVDEVARLVEKAKAAADSPHLTPSAITRRYDQELARTTDHSYLMGMGFVEEFCGRDMLDALHGWLHERGLRLRKNTFVQALEEAVPIAYRANRQLYGTDDFCDLANGVRALAGLPPVA
jgi:hypothetical protein